MRRSRAALGHAHALVLFACCACSWAKRCNETVAENINDAWITSWCGEVNVDWTGELIVAFTTDRKYGKAVRDLKSQFPGDFPDGSLERLESLHAFVAALEGEHLRFLFMEACDGGGLKFVECNHIYRVPETFDSDRIPMRHQLNENRSPTISPGMLSASLWFSAALLALIL